ncbi:MAG: YeiH family protein [Eggerthellaceae bacterium]|nr:YeiH family protein [Eggerthellaceae bacterium]
MNTLTAKLPGVVVCLAIALPCWLLGTAFPVVGGPVFAILVGMLIALVWKKRGRFQPGVAFTSKKILQLAVVVLGFGLNLAEVARVGATSLPIICSTIATALICAYALYKVMKMPPRISTLIGVGSSICGGSAIAATAPVIKANDEEVAQAISVIFLFNVVAALVFPTLGTVLGLSNDGFGLFAGTAVNDTSSVTAAAAAWDGMHPGANALDYATIVKLTRTLAIIPITLVLAFWQMRTARRTGDQARNTFSLKRAFPLFILFFLAASLATTVAVAAGVPESAFSPLKTLAKFLIVMAMAAIGLNTDIVKLVKTGGKPLLMGLICWIAIAAVSLGMQHVLGLW